MLNKYIFKSINNHLKEEQMNIGKCLLVSLTSLTLPVNRANMRLKRSSVTHSRFDLDRRNTSALVSSCYRVEMGHFGEQGMVDRCGQSAYVSLKIQDERRRMMKLWKL